MSTPAIGFRVHSGWAVAVIVRGPLASLEVLSRERLDLLPPGVPKQPFHHVEHFAVDRAAALIAHWKEQVREAGTAELRRVLQQGKVSVPTAALLLSSARELPPLPKVLASHAAIHAAEGEFYRESTAHACNALGLPVIGIREKAIFEEASRVLRVDANSIRMCIDGFRQRLGPPWSQDEKLAALAALLATRSNAATAR